MVQEMKIAQDRKIGMQYKMSDDGPLRQAYFIGYVPHHLMSSKILMSTSIEVEVGSRLFFYWYYTL